MSPNFRLAPGQLKEIFDRLSTSQKVSLITVTAITILSILVLLIWANRPQYTILFSDLANSDAAKIRDRLQDEKVTYRLRDGGSTILVPKGRVYDLRLQLAADGIPSQPGAGYEIFDRTNLGMSDFVQKLNYRRALEGELGRTISGIDEVEQARVHVVMPEPALFREDEKETTASVVLKTKGRSRLGEDQIRGIAILVARSVEGLDPENVIILDSNGNLLSGAKAPDAMVGLSATQLELQHKVESYLASKAQSMLDGVLGPGRSIVRVSAELDFQTIERTREYYDPESAVVRSEERTESVTSGGGSPETKEENSLSNYEINKTVEHLVNTGGSIIRLSVAVMVDGIYETSEDGAKIYTPRPSDEMTALGNMVRGALGIREDRGDVLEITNIAFDNETFVDVKDTWSAEQNKDLLITLLPKVILGIVLLVLLLMVRGFLKRNLNVARHVLENEGALMPANRGAAQLMPGQPGVKKSPLSKIELPELDEEIPKEVKEAQAKKDQLADFAKTKPELATMLVRSWLLES